jgi:hypothetical protein
MTRPRFLIISAICTMLFSSASAWAFQHVVIADFSSGVDENGVPAGWQLKERSGKADFSIIKESGIYALHLRSEDTSYALQKPVNVDPRTYPLLSWKWKVTELPDGGDFRTSETDDQAAQLFVAFSDRKVIAYIWDSNAPQGLMEDACELPFVTIKAIVVRSGPSETGRWIAETRNAHDDYVKLFGHEPPKIGGIRIQINSQHTETSGESFFADVVFSKHEDEVGDQVLTMR